MNNYFESIENEIKKESEFFGFKVVSHDFVRPWGYIKFK